MKRYRNGEIWDFEHEMPVMGSSNEVILGLDGGTTSTVCICMPLLPVSDPLPDPLPVLAKAVAGCSNHNSVGGKKKISLFGYCLSFLPFALLIDVFDFFLSACLVCFAFS